MSYILDAIRKAEQERQKQQSPELMRVNTPVSSAVPKRHSWLLFALLLVAVVVVTVMVNIWFLQEKPAQSVRVTPAPDAKVLAPPAGRNGSNTQDTAVVGKEANTPVTPVVKPALNQRLPLWQAPAQAKAAINALQFSFHVYSDNPARRTIIINRKRMREGQQISADLQLHGINEQGVVIAYQDLLVEVSVLEQW